MPLAPTAPTGPSSTPLRCLGCQRTTHVTDDVAHRRIDARRTNCEFCGGVLEFPARFSAYGTSVGPGQTPDTVVFSRAVSHDEAQKIEALRLTEKAAPLAFGSQGFGGPSRIGFALGIGGFVASVGWKLASGAWDDGRVGLAITVLVLSAASLWGLWTLKGRKGGG